ncbi:hypothetical protein NIE88_21995 [Sporolactobacillus shoreicorticis]|uniref:Uncharacterized protein n=1 Tax=Sporolactobacillus shoreicorticis TaxID=1923877 RepID=A0ABW5RZ07_9BACL|nr:hypothetical protein [Sporolactobacillus shoreicorticis]MCO7128397.1 hypothetical protein [Sporolactobacillus shoreicorticis]
MRFLPLYLFANQQTGSDPLGNPINELVQRGESVGRFSSWTAEEIALDNRKVTQNNRKIITRATKADLLSADKIKFEDLYHSITEIRGDDTTRWRIVVVNRYGSETA